MGFIKFLVCPDSFKDALPASQVARAIAAGILKASPDAEIYELPLADGGEGSLEAFQKLKGVEAIPLQAQDALHRKMHSHYLVLNEKTALIELAQTAGLEKLTFEERNPLNTSTYGVGQQMAHARQRGLGHFVLFVGGSATNDGGAGLLEALGVGFFDSSGRKLKVNGGNLEKIHRLNLQNLTSIWRGCRIEIACDVQNPLLGSRGASQVYAPQKGANPEMVTQLEINMQHWADILISENPDFDPQLPGMGAAGGIAASLCAFLNAKLSSGFGTVAKLVNLEKAITESDIIFTGEGSVDGQTLEGKAPLGVAKLALKHSKPVVCLCGRKGSGYAALYPQGITAVFSIVNRAMPLGEALAETSTLLSQTAEDVVRLLKSKYQA